MGPISKKGALILQFAIVIFPPNMYIFNFNPLDSRHSKAKLYYFKIYVEDVLVRDFIPCYRNSDNVVGMYDLVSNTFFVNQGTGTFTKGSDAQLPTPDYPERIRVVGDNINLFDETQLGSERDYQCTSSVSNNEITLTSTSSSGEGPLFLTTGSSISVGPPGARGVLLQDTAIGR